MKDKTRRCDGCTAEAWVSVKKANDARLLDFCAHHYEKHSIMLHANGWEIAEDERDLINTKPSVSANAV